MHAGLLGPSTVAARPRGAASAAPAYAARPSAAASPSLSPSSPVRLSPAPGRLAGSLVVVRAVGGKGGGVLDRPDLDVNKATVKKAVLAPKYKLLLHNDPVNRRDYVVTILLKVVDGLTNDDATRIMAEAHENGLALVIITTQELAEGFCNGLRGNGLVSTVEPES